MSVRWVPLVAVVLLALMMAPDGARREPAAEPTWRAPRTPTAASAARPASPRASSTRAGRPSGSRPPGGTPPTSRAGGTSLLDYLRAQARTSATRAHEPERPRRSAAIARGAPGATSSRSSSPSGGTAPSRTASTPRRSRSSRSRRGSDEDVKPAVALRWLKTQANADGGFNFAGEGGASGIDDTQRAAAGARRRRPAQVRRRSSAPCASSPASRTPTAASRSAPAATPTPSRPPGRSRDSSLPAGTRPRSAATARAPLAYLRSLTAADGAVRYSRTSDQTPVWVTAQALAALARRPFPLPTRGPHAARRALLRRRRRVRSRSRRRSPSPSPSRSRPSPRPSARSTPADRRSFGMLAAVFL